MKPVICKVKDNPPVTYGDCLRACVASLLELESDEVPHFMINGNPTEAMTMMREFLASYRIVPAAFPVSGELPLDDFFGHMSEFYPDTEYLLFCNCGGEDHCIICRNEEIIHNPSWINNSIRGPHSTGFWIAIILARLS